MDNKKIFAIDVGKIRIGIARLDDRGAPEAIKTSPRAQGAGERDLKELLPDDATLVVGVPLDEADQITDTGIDIFRFCRRLLRRHPTISIQFVDEYGSSMEAEEQLGRSESTRKAGKIDELAAKIILSRFLSTGADPRISACFQAWLKEGITNG